MLETLFVKCFVLTGEGWRCETIAQIQRERHNLHPSASSHILGGMASNEVAIGRDSMGFEDIDEFWDATGTVGTDSTLEFYEINFLTCVAVMPTAAIRPSPPQ